MEAPPFTPSSLWKKPVINPLNGKSWTLPIFNLRNSYGRSFHLAWLGFFVAFLSWFAFSPLTPVAIKSDLRLTTAQVGNSNIIALLATLVVRFVVGPACDRWGPRKCMAVLLILGAIPSGLAGTATNAGGLYAIRFFIGILGGTFVPCQAWATLFFDKKVVGTANALVAGWGNAGGGVTFVVQTSLFDALVKDGMSSHTAWRAAFAIVPVPILLFVAAITLIFGTDCPAGRWSDRHNLTLANVGDQEAPDSPYLGGEKEKKVQTDGSKEGHVSSEVQPVDDVNAPVDFAVPEKLTWKSAGRILSLPHTWLPALMYMSTFGFELCVDTNLATVLFNTQKSASFGQTKAGYYASIFGFLNIVTRPLGGYLGDRIYRIAGVKGKKYLAVVLGFLQGVCSLAMGLWMQHQYNTNQIPSLGVQIALVVLMALFCEMANGVNFSLVPHINASHNGLMSGLVGGCGNLGGIFFALIFRFHATSGYATAWWISGVFAMALNLICVLIPLPSKYIS